MFLLGLMFVASAATAALKISEQYYVEKNYVEMFGCLFSKEEADRIVSAAKVNDTTEILRLVKQAQGRKAA